MERTMIICTMSSFSREPMEKRSNALRDVGLIDIVKHKVRPLIWRGGSIVLNQHPLKLGDNFSHDEGMAKNIYIRSVNRVQDESSNRSTKSEFSVLVYLPKRRWHDISSETLEEMSKGWESEGKNGCRLRADLPE